MNLSKYVVGALLVLAAGCVKAGDWTSADTARQGVVLTTFALDYGQTKDIKNHSNLHETNRLMGQHPGDARVRNYFIAAGAAHSVIAYNLPPEWRRSFQYSTIALELLVIAHNRQIGLHYEF